MEGRETEFLPEEAAGLAAEGIRRLTDYQDAEYAATYLSRISEFADHPAATPAFLSAFARHLAVRMSYEDTHRVAELKLRGARLSRVRAEAKSREGDIVDVAEYMKPGPEEIFGMFPETLGKRLMAMSDRRGWGKVSFPMKVRTTRFSGFIRLKFLAYAKRWRKRSLRHAEEMAFERPGAGDGTADPLQHLVVVVVDSEARHLVRGRDGDIRRPHAAVLLDE